MSNPILGLLAGWAGREPAASLMMLIAATLLFAVSLHTFQSRQGGYGTGLERLFLSLRQAALFVGILAAAYFLLDAALFQLRLSLQGRAVDAQLAEEVAAARRLWGGGVNQQELSVRFTRSREVVDEIKVAGKDQPMYLNRTVVEEVQQDGLTSFDGQVKINIQDPRVNSFLAETRFAYEVTNISDYVTDAAFRFEIQRFLFYDQLHVIFDGREAPYRLVNDAAVWHATMEPGQVSRVIIEYSVRGVESFTYSVPEPRGIQAFVFSVALDRPGYYTVTKPDPEGIHKQALGPGEGYGTRWSIDHAIMSPQLGIQLKPTLHQDPAPAQAVRMAELARRGVMLLGLLIVLTSIVIGVPVDLARLALLAAAYGAQFVGMLGLELLGVHYLAAYLTLSAGVVALSVVLYRPVTGRLVRLFAALTFLFSLCYPLAGLLTNAQMRNAIDTAVQTGILLYLFALTLIARVLSRRIVKR